MQNARPARSGISFLGCMLDGETHEGRALAVKKSSLEHTRAGRSQLHGDGKTNEDKGSRYAVPAVPRNIVCKFSMKNIVCKRCSMKNSILIFISLQEIACLLSHFCACHFAFSFSKDPERPIVRGRFTKESFAGLSFSKRCPISAFAMIAYIRFYRGKTGS